MNEMSLSTKEEIRRESLRRRNLLGEEERAKASLAICRAVSEDDLFIDARGVHVYLPFGSEVDIHPLIELSWELGKDVGLMRVSEDGGTAQYSILPSTTYQRTKLGILEPVDAEPFDMNVCDLVIVPTLAADLGHMFTVLAYRLTTLLASGYMLLVRTATLAAALVTAVTRVSCHERYSLPASVSY